jgi:MFS family permease
MAAVNRKRVFLGALAGGAVWSVWGVALNLLFLEKHYMAGQQAGLFLQEPRYPFFAGQWILTLFICAFFLASLYARVRVSCGPGPKTALQLGAVVGFIAGFPLSFANATWSPIPRIIPLGWMLEMWVGAILATLVAGWLYKD